MENPVYIDFGVAPYALPDVCEALYNNGITNAFLTKEDGDIHVRWRYKIDRKWKDKGGTCSPDNSI